MKQIKTIQYRCDYYEDFDNDVNDALKNGWILVKRLVLSAYAGKRITCHRVYVAYLEREIPG